MPLASSSFDSNNSSNFHLRFAEFSMVLLCPFGFNLGLLPTESDEIVSKSLTSNFLLGCCRAGADLSFVFLMATGFFFIPTGFFGRVFCTGYVADDSNSGSASISSCVSL